jgi:nitroimidazol reductase NimA-like FMN-containing flavoprotein (pyridoxamine 5'-phosphate oxidase superfamily)
MMVINEMSIEECVALLVRSTLFRLGCARDNQPYVIPISLAYDKASASLYGFTTLGQKIQWMRTNPLVCVQADDIAAPDQWKSVVVNGRFEELPQTPPTESNSGRLPERAGSEDTPAALLPPEERPLSAATVGAGHEPRAMAFDMLSRLPAWWQPGSAAWAQRAHLGSTERFVSIFFRIRVESMTGHVATR